MALRITDDCINCDLCAPECPNKAIAMGVEIFEIDRGRCTECVGHHDEPRCIEVCPADSVICDPEYSEDRNALLNKYQRLTAGDPGHGQSLARKSA